MYHLSSKHQLTFHSVCHPNKHLRLISSAWLFFFSNINMQANQVFSQSVKVLAFPMLDQIRLFKKKLFKIKFLFKQEPHGPYQSPE